MMQYIRQINQAPLKTHVKISIGVQSPQTLDIYVKAMIRVFGLRFHHFDFAVLELFP